jgi:hypothetical protein
LAAVSKAIHHRVNSIRFVYAFLHAYLLTYGELGRIHGRGDRRLQTADRTLEKAIHAYRVTQRRAGDLQLSFLHPWLVGRLVYNLAHLDFALLDVTQVYGSFLIYDVVSEPHWPLSPVSRAVAVEC